MASEDVIANLSVKGQAAFSQAMSQAGRSAKDVGQESAAAGAKSGVSAKGLLKAAAAAGVAYKGYQTLKGSVNTTVEMAKSTAAFSRASGLSAKESGRWVAVAKSRNIETKQLQMGMATFGRQLGATGGSSKAADAALGKLGLTQKALIAMPMEQRMSAVADSFSKMADGPEKAALAQKLFGRSGQQLLPILNEGSAALKGQLDAAGKLIPVTDQSQKSALALAKSQREMGMATDGLKMAIGTALIPILASLTKAAQPVVGAFAKLMNSSSVARGAILALAGTLAAVKLASWVSGVKMVVLWTKLWAAAQWLINAAMVAFPVFAVIAAIAALAAGLYLLWTRVKWVRDNWQLLVAGLLTITGPVGWVIAAFILFKDQIIGAVKAVVDFVSGAATSIIGAVGSIPGAISSAVGSMVSAFTGAISSIAGAVAKIVSAIVGALGALPGKLKSAAGNAVNALVSGFTGAIGKVADIGHKIIEAIVNAIKSGASAVSDAVKSIIPDVGGMVGDAVKSVGGALNPTNWGTGGLISAQTGNTVRAGGRQLVGERGPELANFPSGTRITPLAPPSLLPSQLTGGGGDRPIVVPVYLNDREIMRAVGSYSADRQATR